MTEDAREGVFSRVLSWLGSHEREFLIILVLAATAAWAFVEIADEVMEGDTADMDERIVIALRVPGDTSDPIGPGWFEEMARDFTSLGGVGVLTFLTLASAGYLCLVGKWRMAIYVIVSIGCGILLSSLMKAGFSRPRPDLVPHGARVYTSSFPSGHAFMSAVVYLTLGALLAAAQDSFRLRAYLISVAALLTLLVGLSRIYLGVHWPTDVLGGWTAGAAWALLCFAFAAWLTNRGSLDSERAK